MQIPLGEVIGALPDLRTIDIRTVEVKENGRWRNALSVIRILPFPQSEIAEAHNALRQSSSRISGQHLRCKFAALEISQIPKVKSALAMGLLPFRDGQVVLEHKIKFDDLNAHVGRSQGFLRDDHWPTAEVFTSWSSELEGLGFLQNPQYRLQSQEIAREISLAGFGYPANFMNEIFGIRPNYQLQYPGDLYIAVCIPFRISHAQIPNTGKLFVAADHLGEGSAMSFRLEQIAYDGSRKRLPYAVETVRQLEAGEQTIFAAQLEDCRETAKLEAGVILEGLGEIYADSWEPKNLVPSERHNLLLRALAQFCEIENFRLLLTAPHNVSVRSKPQAEFERHVSWLLGLIGFPTIVLGKHEQLVENQTKHQHGSVDILALEVSSGCLILVACTLNPPKEDDLATLKNLRAIINSRLPNELVRAALFTAAKDYTRSTKAHVLAPDDIAIFNSERISTALKLVELRREDIVSQYLISGYGADELDDANLGANGNG